LTEAEKQTQNHNGHWPQDQPDGCPFFQAAIQLVKICPGIKYRDHLPIQKPAGK